MGSRWGADGEQRASRGGGKGIVRMSRVGAEVEAKGGGEGGGEGGGDIRSMWGDTGLVEYSLVYKQIHMLCGNGLNIKSVCCTTDSGAMCTHGNVWACI